MPNRPLSTVGALERHPLSIAERATLVASAATARQRTQEQNLARQREIDEILHRAAQQARTSDGRWDFAAVQCLGGSTADDVERRMVELHSESSGIQDVIAEQARTIIEQAERDAAAEEARLAEIGTAAPSRTAVQRASDQFFASDGDQYRETIRRRQPYSYRREIDSQVRGRELFAALFRTDGAAPSFIPFLERDQGITLSAQPPLYLTEVIWSTGISQPQAQYVRQTTHTPGAGAQDGQGTALGEAEYATEIVNAPVQTIGEVMPVTLQALEDDDDVATLIDALMPMSVMRALDKQLVLGTNANGQLQGITTLADTSEVVMTADAQGDITSGFDHIWAAREKVLYDPGYSIATHVVLNPRSWGNVALERSTAGGYYGGSPFDNFTERAWSMPVIQNPHLERGAGKNTGFVIDLTPMFNTLRFMRDITTDFGYVADDFKKVQQHVRSFVRAVLVLKRATSICRLKQHA